MQQQAMTVMRRLISVLIGAALAATALDGCATSANETVAHVAGLGSISKGTLEHWVQVEAVELHELLPTKPIPKGVIPDPPRYSACIHYLQYTRRAQTTPRLGTTQLKSACAQQYHELKELTLDKLIGWKWTIGNGAAVGIKVSETEARANLRSLKQVVYPRPIEFATYLKRTRQTVADMLYRSKIQLLESNFRGKLIKAQANLPSKLTPEQKIKALENFAARWPTRQQWAAKTSCISGYITSYCKQYHGPLKPGTTNT